MARKLGALVLEHPKKSALYAIVSSGTLTWFYDYSMTNDAMSMHCKTAVSLGDRRLRHPKAQTRHLTVILNPVAGKRKAKKLYTKWVEPLLHLAGIRVSLIETESPNQAYDLMKVMSNCDGVVVVGGDGTVNEVLNGLLSRPDSSKAVRDFPIGIIPVGQYNSIARYIHQDINYRNQKDFLMKSTMKVVECQTEKHDVLKIQPLNEDIREREKPVYALRDIKYGKYQDNIVKLSGFLLYQTYFRPYWLRFQRLFMDTCPMPQIEYLSYTRPCLGCSRCLIKHKLNGDQSVESEEAQGNRRWWNIVTPAYKKAKPSDQELTEQRLSKVDNPDCDKRIPIVGVADITDFRACMMGDKKVRLSLGYNGEYKASEVIETQDVFLKLDSALDVEKLGSLETGMERNNSPSSPEDNNAPSEQTKKVEDKTVKFLIDGQPTQAKSIEITALHKPVKIFAGLEVRI